MGDESCSQPKRKIDDMSADEDCLYRPITSTSLSSSPIKTLLTQIPDGVAFVSLINQKKRFYLPSSNNFFGGYKVTRVMCDSGCSSVILPIESVDALKQIFLSFRNNCEFSIKRSKNSNGNTVCLVVEYLMPKKRFEVNLCSDIMRHAGIYTDKLRFPLCQEDIEAIQISDNLLSLLPEGSRYRLKTANGNINRRTHAILGQDILYGFCLIKYKQVEFYVDPSTYQLPKSFMDLRGQTSSLEVLLRRDLPDQFDEWLDDDFANEDDEMLSVSDFA